MSVVPGVLEGPEADADTLFVSVPRYDEVGALIRELSDSCCSDVELARDWVEVQAVERVNRLSSLVLSDLLSC